MEKVFSEDPENDLWRELLQFSYDVNIFRYFSKNSLNPENDNVPNYITGAFLQAYEYFRSSKSADLQILPLLLYYGATNLLYGMAILITGSIIKIQNHGMKIDDSKETNYIAETTIKFNNPTNGGVHVLAKAMGFEEDLTKTGTWQLKDFLDSIAEISEDYKKCYDVPCGRIVMLDVFKTPNGVAEKVYYSPDNKNDIINLLYEVEGFKDTYLRIEPAKDIQNHTEYLLLKHKLNGKDISEISFSGQPYLRAAHKKNGKQITIPTVFNMYIGLYILGTLCRYYPQRWSLFVTKDNTGEKLLIEKFLYFARRMIPNFVLNKIMGYNIQYVSDKYHTTDTIKLVGEHEIKDIVKKEVTRQLESNHIVRRG